MANEHLAYKSFCWVIGTTSFRTAELDARLEEQLLLISQFRNAKKEVGDPWVWNPETQSKFYDYLKSHDELTGTAKRKDKDARQKTSGLVTLGIVDKYREVTEAGRYLLSLRNVANEPSGNLLGLSKRNFFYLNQLTKTTISTDGKSIRPFFVLAHLLNSHDYLTLDEFKYLLPLAMDPASLAIVHAGIVGTRAGTTSVEDVIVDALRANTNFDSARAKFMREEVSIQLICDVGMNRKSPTYDKPYFNLFVELRNVFLDGDRSVAALLRLNASTNSISGRPGSLWKKLLFAGATLSKIKKLGFSSLPRGGPFDQIGSEANLKNVFFRQLHLFKSFATLDDYHDLNRRYFWLSDSILFSDARVRFDTAPKAFFALRDSKIRSEMFTRSSTLQKYDEQSEDVLGSDVSEKEFLQSIANLLDKPVGSISEAQSFLRDERYSRLHRLLDSRFTKEVLGELLECFIRRDDREIARIVTDNATISTIFEYVTGLIWYEISDRSGEILEYMKLALDADLLPKSHAPGGTADIVYEYEQGVSFPAHSLLLEVTLADEKAIRRMEMEPVSRHLGLQLHSSGNSSDYCVFVSPSIDLNVSNDFRFRKEMGYLDTDGRKSPPLKIIPINIEQLKKLLKDDASYVDIFTKFEQAYNSREMESYKWLQELNDVLFSKN